MPNPYNPNPYNEDQDRARQQPLYDQPGGPRQDASQEYHKGDGVFQIPWWVIVITFCFAAWPIGVAMMIINHLLRMGKISAPQSWSQNNRQTGQPYTVRPIYADPQKAEKMRRDAQRVVQRAEEAAHKAEKRVEFYQNADRAQAYEPEQTARQNERGRKDKGEGWSIALTVLGVIFSIAMVANLPEAVYWLPEALTQGGSYWTWLFQDLAGSVTLLFAGAGFLFAGWKLRTGRRMRKKGVARLAEIMGRDMWNFFRAGFLAFLGCLPFIIGMFFAVETHALLFMLLAGIIGGLIAKLEIMADTVLRSLRDEPGYWWETYRRVWKRNARESLVPGMLTGLVLSMQIFTLFHMSVISAGIVTWVLLILSFVVTLGLESYIWPQIALLDLPLYGILKNSLLLFLGYLPRSLGAIAIKAVYWGAILLFFPLTTIILPFTNFWLPMLPALLCIYQPLNKCFTIESTINKMREDELNAALAKDNEPLPEDPTEKAEESTEASSDDSSSDVQ